MLEGVAPHCIPSWGDEVATGAPPEGTSVAHRNDDTRVIHPEIFTLHWEGQSRAEPAGDPSFANSVEEQQARAEEREREWMEIRKTERGRALWEQIRREAASKGDEELWQRKLHAYWWVKMAAQGTAGDYAKRCEINHATVRSWIRDVARLAYEVGYRLHEDKLLLVGSAPRGLQRLRELVNRDAASAESLETLRQVEREFRGCDPYFHLNEGHILRAHGLLRESDRTLQEGLTIAEARRVRSLLWNARGQTFWDCGPESSFPLPDFLDRAEKAFRRAAILDPTTYFPFVNLAQIAVDARDLRRAEYWVGELSGARKRMDDEMRDGLARYLDEAEWTRPVEGKRFWRSGPRRWLEEAVRRGVLPLLAFLLLWVGLSVQPASGYPTPSRGLDTVAAGGGGSSGAGGN